MKNLIKRIIFLFSIVLTFFSENVLADNYRVPVGDFTSLIVSDNVNVVYRCLPDSAGFAQYSGAKEFADAFIFSNNGKGQLKIQVNSEDVNNPSLPTVYVYSSELTKVENGSNFTILVDCTKPVQNFKAKIIGNGKIEAQGIHCQKLEANVEAGSGSIILHGDATEATYRMVGAGVIQADGLRAKVVKCGLFGGGEIGCYAGESLSSKGIGSTKIYYLGNPVKVKKSGGGKLIPLKS